MKIKLIYAVNNQVIVKKKTKGLYIDSLKLIASAETVFNILNIS